jgi:transcriptional regulator with XRE-family HTH domain
MSIGNAIKLCRAQKKLTQSALADRVKLSPSYLSQLERDLRDPTLSTLKRLAVGLEVPLTILLFLAGENDELKFMDKELSKSLSYLMMQLLRGESDESHQPALV